MTDEEWIAAYALRYWKRHGQIDWPTVRQTARSLRVDQARVMKAAADAKLFKLLPAARIKRRSDKDHRTVEGGDSLIEVVTDAARQTLARFRSERGRQMFT